MSIKINFSKKEDFAIGLEIGEVEVNSHYPFTGDMENHECELLELTSWSKSVLMEDLSDLLSEVIGKIKDLIKEGDMSGGEDGYLYVLDDESKGTVELSLNYKWSASNYFRLDQRGCFDIMTNEEVEFDKLAYIDTEVSASISEEEAKADGLIIDEVLAENEAIDEIKSQFDNGDKTSGSVGVECNGVYYEVSWELNCIEEVN